MKPYPFALRFVMLVFAGWVSRRQQEAIEYLLEENRVLAEQLGGRRLRLTDRQRRRLAVRGKALGRKQLAEYAVMVTPDTVLRWHRRLVARTEGESAERRPGRPRTRDRVAPLVVRMAEENVSWGYTRLQGALRSLDHEVGRNTIKRILLEHGIEPAPERRKRTPWSTFLKAHLEALSAAGFSVGSAVAASIVLRFVTEVRAAEALLARSFVALWNRDPRGAPLFHVFGRGSGGTSLHLLPRGPDLPRLSHGVGHGPKLDDGGRTEAEFDDRHRDRVYRARDDLVPPNGEATQEVGVVHRRVPLVGASRDHLQAA